MSSEKTSQRFHCPYYRFTGKVGMIKIWKQIVTLISIIVSFHHGY